MLLSNHKMLHCNSISSRFIPGDQELLKSGHWNSILWFITMNFIDLVYTEDVIWQSIWACALLWGSKCVLSLCFVLIWNEQCILQSQLFLQKGNHIPLGVPTAATSWQWDTASVYPKGRDLSRADWLCTGRIEECLHDRLQRFSQREVGVGKKSASCWWVLIFSYRWSFQIAGTWWLCWRQLHNCPNSTRLLAASNKFDFCQALSTMELKTGLAVPWIYSPPPYAAVEVIITPH